MGVGWVQVVLRFQMLKVNNRLSQEKFLGLNQNRTHATVPLFMNTAIQTGNAGAEDSSYNKIVRWRCNLRKLSLNAIKKTHTFIRWSLNEKKIIDFLINWMVVKQMAVLPPPLSRVDRSHSVTIHRYQIIYTIRKPAILLHPRNETGPF